MATELAPPLITVGTIVDVMPGPRWFLVRTGAGERACVPVSYAGVGALSPRSLGLFSIGDTVLVCVLAETPSDSGIVTDRPEGYILAAVPMQFGDASKKYRQSDYLYAMLGNHAMNNAGEQASLAAMQAQVQDRNAGQPLDANAGSDFGVINELGVAQGIARLVASLRASELAGVWCFFNDNLTRIAAYNYERWTAGGERWIKNDEGEVNDVELFTPYPWEATGVSRPGIVTPDAAGIQLVDGGGAYTPGAAALAYEPKHADQLMYPRLMRLRGYIGDLEQEFVVLPHLQPTPDADEQPPPSIERYANQSEYTGLLAIQKHINGLYSVRSAKGIVHEKTIDIAVPKQVAPPEQSDALGAGATNYLAAGVYGADELDPTEHAKNDWTAYDTQSALIWQRLAYDYSAYMFNYYGLKPVLKKFGDWYLPEAGRFLGQDVGIAYPGQQLNQLTTQFELDLPQVFKAQVDHRPGTTRYFQSKSVIAQLDDGSILLQDGYGASIHMTGGNIHVSAPGDVWMRPGRSVITWAPDDIVLRAGKSCDITTAGGDVRIKSEFNLQMLAGNGDYGGIVMETRAPMSTGVQYTGDVGEDARTYGIVMRCVNTTGEAIAPIMAYASDVYVKAFGGHVSADASAVPGATPAGGAIVLDATGRANVSGDEVTVFADQGITHLLGKSLATTQTELDILNAIGDTVVMNRFTRGLTYFGGDTFTATEASSEPGGSTTPADVRGAVFYVGADRVVFDNYNDRGDDFVVTGSVRSVGGFHSFFGGRVSAVLTAYLEELTEYVTTELVAGIVDDVVSIYEDGVRGDAEFIRDIGFTLRTSAQYGAGASRFYVPETIWQAAAAASVTTVWEEPSVDMPGSGAAGSSVSAGADAPTMPHPGYAAWAERSVFVVYSDQLYQPTGNAVRARSPEAYELGELTQADVLLAKQLAGNYIVLQSEDQEFPDEDAGVDGVAPVAGADGGSSEGPAGTVDEDEDDTDGTDLDALLDLSADFSF